MTELKSESETQIGETPDSQTTTLTTVSANSPRTANQETSDIPFKIIRTSTKKRGGSIRRAITMGQCILCTTVTTRISRVIERYSSLPPVISSLVSSYFDSGDQFIGYVQLHKRSRRCVHVLCTGCYETSLDVALNSYKRWIQCPHARCFQYVYLTHIYPHCLV